MEAVGKWLVAFAVVLAIVGGAVNVPARAGHFRVARLVGVKPRAFSIGFPPALVTVRRNGIGYGIGAIPLGGYMRIRARRPTR